MNVLQTAGLSCSTYDRGACQLGIVHLGYGAFHRAHQAVFIDDYMQRTQDLRWGIAAVNLRASESAAFAKMTQASEGYVLKTTAPSGEDRFQLVRPHIGFCDWSQTAEAAEALLCQSSVHMVTITVTESGYYLDEAGQGLNLKDPVIAAEIAGDAPISVYGYLARALRGRMNAHGQPVTLVCCDNIRANGKMLRACLLSYLTQTGQDDLVAWVQEHVTFPCSMVDRITPRATPELQMEIATRFADHALTPVHGETFIQWVLEDHFAAEAPDLAKAGVEVVEDVDPFEEAKIRILNGGHSGLCYLGALAGHETFDQVMTDPVLLAHFKAWEYDNILPGLTLDLPFDKLQYCQDVMDRFGNIAISDRLERICMDGWSKMPIYIRPTLESCLAQGITPSAGFISVASWYVYARRIAAGQMPITYHDPYWDRLAPLLEPGRESDFARNHSLWAELPQTYSEFTPGIVSAIKQMEQTWPA